MTRTIAILYILFGLLLAWMIPALNVLHAQRFSDWNTSASLLVRMFHVPGYIWLVPFAAASLALLYAGSRVKGKYLTALNISSSVLLLIFVIHFFDLFTMFIFCHEGGCGGGHLPTWNLLP